MIKGLACTLLSWALLCGAILSIWEYLIRSQQTKHEATCVKGKVVSIGGCSREGNCGISVLAKNEIVFGVWSFPTINQTVCIKPRRDAQ